jgi:hypothetical protein
VALTPAAVTAAILAAAPEMAGPTGLILAQAVGAAVVPWANLPANLALTGITTGTVGAGTVLGALTVPPNVAVVSGALAAAGVVGPTSAILAKAIAIGISTSFSTAQYAGPSIGVGVGADVSVMAIVNPFTLIPLLSAGLTGASGPLVSTGIGNGIANLLALGTGIGAVTGSPSTTPGTGTSGPSKVF